MSFSNIFRGGFNRSNTLLLILLLILIIIPALGSGGYGPSGYNFGSFSPYVAGAGTGDCNQFGFFNRYGSQSGFGSNILFIILIIALIILLGSSGNPGSDDEDTE